MSITSKVYGHTGAGERSSNIELLRIVAMFMVIAGHFLSGSGLESAILEAPVDAKKIWIHCFGLWGKTAINSFVLISGYFMCKKKLTAQRFLKIFFQMEFYNFICYLILLLLGYEEITASRIFHLLFWPFIDINKYFGESFIWFYLFIPFYNIIVEHSSKRQMYTFVGLGICMFSVSASFFFNGAVFHHVGWYVVLYFIGASIRLYPQRWMLSNKICGWSLFLMITIVLCFVIAYDFRLIRLPGITIEYYFLVQDSNKIFSLAIGVLLFLLFRNMKVGYSNVINVVASTTFGVLLIHTAGDGMRKLIWGSIFSVQEHYYGLTPISFIGFSLLTTLLIFICCSVVDYGRICLIEKPAFKRIFSAGDKR